jgi:putative acetyltransferase
VTALPEIRSFAPPDGPGCWAVFLAAVRIGARDHYSPAELAEWVSDDSYPPDYADWLAGHITFVAEQGGAIVGFVMMHRDGYLDLLFVLPNQRRTGLAGRLCDALLPPAQALGLMRMTVKASRLAAPFFARRGWRSATTTDDTIPIDPMSLNMEVDL